MARSKKRKEMRVEMLSSLRATADRRIAEVNVFNETKGVPKDDYNV